MGTQLRKIKAERKKLPKDERVDGWNRLTDVATKKLTTYYGNAIKGNNSSVVEMRKVIWAEYFHVSSSNTAPKHQLCPDDS